MHNGVIRTRDRKQSWGHVIMTQRGFIRWLRANQDHFVGWVGLMTRDTPVFAYAKSLGMEFGQQRMPLWARSLRDAYEREELSGKVLGSQAMDTVQTLFGYKALMIYHEEATCEE